jgi:hypothetical protein
VQYNLEHVFNLDYIKFWFKLVDHKMFEMEFKKMIHLKYLEILNLKVIVCQYFDLPHIYGHHFEKKSFVI